MNRRNMLRALIGGAAFAADPERLLYEPGRKLISIPAIVQPKFLDYRDNVAIWLYEFGPIEPHISATDIPAHMLDRIRRGKWIRIGARGARVGFDTAALRAMEAERNHFPTAEAAAEFARDREIGFVVDNRGGD